MPGEYTTIPEQPQQRTTLLAPNYPPGTTGGPIPIAITDEFQYSPMQTNGINGVGGLRAVWGGTLQGVQHPGFYTDGVGDCVAIAIIQYDQKHTPERYFFCHSRAYGTLQDPAVRAAYHEAITAPERAYTALYSTNSSIFGLEMFFNSLNQELGTQLARDQTLFYSGRAGRFALNIQTGEIGEQLDEYAPPAPPEFEGKVILGYAEGQIQFPPSKTSARSEFENLPAPPHGTDYAIAGLTSYDVQYTDDDQYGFGKLQVEVIAISDETVEAKVTLRDDNTNDREWEGNVSYIVLFIGESDPS